MTIKAFITFTGTTEGVIKTFYLTQASANAGATDADITAVTGEQDIPDDALPNVSYWDGDKVLEEIPLSSFSQLEQMKQRMREAHTYLLQLAADLEEEGIAHQITEVLVAHNFPAMAHHACYLVGTDATLTLSQKINWANALVLGPTDASTPLEWYQAISLLSGSPTSPRAWVAPTTANRIAVSATLNANTDFWGEDTISDTVLSDGGWIEELT